MMFFQSARMDTPRFLLPLINYELLHLNFPCLWRRGRSIFGLGWWWVGGLVGSLDPELGRYSHACIGAAEMVA